MRRFLLTYLLLALFFGLSAVWQLRRYPLDASAFAALYLSTVLLLGLYLAPGFAAVRAWLASRFRSPRGAVACTALFLVPYFIYAAGTRDFRVLALAKLAVFAAALFLLYALAPPADPKRLRWQDLLALAWLAFPVVTGRLRGIWSVPINLDFLSRFYLVAVGAWAFLIWRGAENVGYEFRFTRATLRDGLLNWILFSVIALPLGFAIRFIAWNPHWRGPWQFTFDFVTIFLFIAVSEELYFRGLLQNLLEGGWGSRYGAQAVTAVLFGFSHIHHAPFPNWRYVILATIAGWFYGAAYRRTRSLMASATTHALVDTMWRTFLTLPRV